MADAITARGVIAREPGKPGVVEDFSFRHRDQAKRSFGSWRAVFATPTSPRKLASTGQGFFHFCSGTKEAALFNK